LERGKLGWVSPFTFQIEYSFLQFEMVGGL
jgi:hypothetical protein